MDNKNQHYIPVCYLKHFSKEDKNRASQLWCYDIQQSNSYLVQVDEICSGKFYYSTPSNRSLYLVDSNLHKYFEEWIPDVLLDIIQNRKPITKQFIQSIYFIIAHFIIRSDKCCKNMPNKLNIDRDTWLLGAVSFHKNSVYTTYVCDILNNHRYCYCIVAQYQQFFLINNSIPVVSIVEIVPVYSNSYIDTTSKTADIFFPINNNLCIVLTNEYIGNNFYIHADNTKIDLINLSFIQDKTCKYAYSQNRIDDYIQKHLERNL